MVALGLTIAACGYEDSRWETNGTSASDDAGVPVVISLGPEWDDEDRWKVSTHPSLTLGTLGGADASQLFDRVRGAGRLSDGTVVVLDAGSRQVRAFSMSGVHLWSSGGPGDGPGELRDPTHLELLPGDTIQIQDGLGRLRLSPQGEVVSQQRVAFERLSALGFGVGESCLGLPSFVGDDVIACSSKRTPGAIEPGQPFTTALVVARLSWSLTSVDTIATLFRFDGWTVRGLATPASASPSVVPLIAPLGPRGIWWLGGGDPKLLFVRNDAYRIEVYDIAQGSLTRVLERQVGRRARSQVEIDLAINWGLTPSHLRDDLRAHLDRLSVVDSLSIANGFVVDAQDHIWVRLGPSEDDPGTPEEVVSPGGDRLGTILRASGRHDVFAPGGRYLRAVQLPMGFEVLEIGNDHVLGVERDAFGVEYIQVYDLDRRERRGP